MKERVQGKGEEIKGKVTGDRKLEAKGKARQKVGEVKKPPSQSRTTSSTPARSAKKRSGLFGL